MNNIEKVIEYIQFKNEMQLSATRAMIHANGRKRLGKSYLKEMGQRIANYKVAISTLEKQIAKKPLKQPFKQEGFDSGMNYLCPNCKIIVGGYSDDYQEWFCKDNCCRDCGQLLNWSDKG